LVQKEHHALASQIQSSHLLTRADTFRDLHYSERGNSQKRDDELPEGIAPRLRGVRSAERPARPIVILMFEPGRD
jgi:hypothetical protein